MQLFHFWSRDVHPVQNTLLCTKFHENRIIFSLRYGDISILKMAAICHLGIVLPPYETTHEVSVAGRSCLSNFMQSDTQIWRYSYLNFSHICLEIIIQASKMGVLGTLDHKCDHLSSRPPKGTSLRKFASVKLSTVKIRWGVWPVGELTKSVTDMQTDTHTRVNLHSVHA